ncbi:DUF4262 domain-containing protein [Streptomyces sp. WAC05292]|uniref:DUF4262 domain-containing protein n=1 Tax=Streptomyces sp. WAC05292 TaxID=2487418 RepID=UPI000F73EA26|nr:DUF4262 domain-containing protein [Streptomyces sp. WAC05292]RSS86998.1 DUF4262 domain-containing protein [Streptomyces sp. WAC05292]
MSVTSAISPPHTIHYVFDVDGRKPPFAYSSGLAARPGRLYELATTGLPGRWAQGVINSAADQLVNDGLDPGEGLELDAVLQGGYVVRLRRANDTTQCTHARLLASPDVPVWQILTPDKWGFFPGDTHYSEDPEAQPLM